MASFPSPQREPLLDSQLQHVLSQRGKELLGLCLIGVGLLLALILGSFSPEDPSWSAATDAPVQNALGRGGAAIAAPLMVITGLGAWGFVIALCVWGVRLVIHQGEHNILGRTTFVPIAIALGAIWLATLVPAADWAADHGLGGKFGDAVLGAVLSALPLTSTFGFNLLTVLTFAGALVLWLYVLGASVPELWRIGGFLLSGLILSYAALMSLLGSTARGAGGLAVRSHHRRQERRAAQDTARHAAYQAVDAHPEWQESHGAWQNGDVAQDLHTYRAPRIHRPDPQLADPYHAAQDHAYAPAAPHPRGYAPHPAGYGAPQEANAYARPEPNLTAQHRAAPHRTAPALQRTAQTAPHAVAEQPWGHAPEQAWDQPWDEPERQGLLARVSNLGRRRVEPDRSGWSAPEGELIEPQMPPQAMAAQAPSEDRLRNRITDVIRTRKQSKPVLRIDPHQPPAPLQTPAPAEPPLTAARREPALSSEPAARQSAAQPGIGYSHSFGLPGGQTVYPGATHLDFGAQTARQDDDALIEDDGYDDYDVPPPAPTGRVLTRRVVQTPQRRAPAPSRQAQAEAQPTLPFEAPRQKFELPPLSLLSDPKKVERYTLSNEALEENARMLESVLEDYGVRGEIVSVRPGPVVTMYELEPAPGLKASRVIGLSDDIARSMSALSARVSTVPGRSVIGIELPNVRREKVVLREILGSRDFGDGNQNLPLALGKDIGGESIVANLAKMPHLLIAGTTGSGKSVAINTMILSLLYKLTPEECRLIMIDPKMLELSVYDGIPHLLSPVVTDPKKAVVALKWVVGEMEERYRKMSKMGVRNIEGYNGRVREALGKNEMFKRTVQTGFDDETGDPVFETEEFAPEVLPFIVVIVDEMADLMMVAGKEIEACIQRLAQMARASGIHLIMATQRPSVDVITGTIKANFPTRISFQVTSKIDSRTILGEQGAEQLLGMGDMLYMAGGSKITRVHGPFVSDEEVEEIVTHLKSFGPADYVGGVLDGPDPESVSDIDAVLGLADSGGEDALYDQAVAIVARDRKCSTSYIQRKLAIGYNKAARLVEQMEDEGVVSSANHVGKREILVPEGH